jgi:putative transcriptional regulator
MSAVAIQELLPLYALGVLDADESREVEKAIAADPTLAAELDSYRAAALELVEPVTPTPSVKARLVATIGGGRFEKYASRAASLLDVTVERARELFGLVERAASWETPVPGIGLIHFNGGPAAAAADCGFVRIQPGCTFPWHNHRGDEVSIILSGRLRDHTGRVLGPGDELVQTTGSAHDLQADGDEEVIFVARAMNGIEVVPRP